MAKERTRVRMQTQIKIISEQGHSIRTIARVLRLSRRTVRKYFRTGAVVAGENRRLEVQIDWDYVRQEVDAKGTTITDRAGSGAGNQVRKILAGLLGVCQPAGLAQ